MFSLRLSSKGIGNIKTVMPRKPNSILVGLHTKIQRLFLCPIRIHLRMMITFWRTQFYEALSALLLIFVRFNLHRVYLLLPQITVPGSPRTIQNQNISLFDYPHSSKFIIVSYPSAVQWGGVGERTLQPYTAGLHCRPIKFKIIAIE